MSDLFLRCIVNVANILLLFEFEKLRSKGKSSPQPPVSRNVTTAPAPEWNQTPEPVAQLPSASSVTESTTQVSQEAYASEEGE